jgi:hypothetical protein
MLRWVLALHGEVSSLEPWQPQERLEERALQEIGTVVRLAPEEAEIHHEVVGPAEHRLAEYLLKVG